ncbi:MAG TPA: ABC transporter permease [Candidatus Dormibacteraeota bacterium]|jgi:ABC-2 type transport system permease protein|nr:ABC transporter permease [Candidatus Dormibacteraeota bacterium]
MHSEIRAALAIARKDLLQARRYPVSFLAWIFTTLYQGVIPVFLFGAAFATGGRLVGLERSVGTDDLAGFIFLGGMISGLVANAFWGMAMSFRNEMNQGTLEPTWLTPTSHQTLVLGRALGSLVFYALSQVVLLTIGYAFFGLRFRADLVLAAPAIALAIVAMVGVAYLIAGAVLLIKDADLFVDTTNFLFSTTSGTAFPITVLPAILQPIALLLPTTYAVDLLRHQALGARALFDPVLEYAVLALLTVAVYPLGRFAFARADGRLRRTGALAQH